MEKLTDKKFLEDKHIGYIIEKDDAGQENIIPIGIVDFIDRDKYDCGRFIIFTTSKNKELYRANQIINNVKRAIQLKYEAYIFINKFDYRQQITTEEEELWDMEK